MEFCSVFNFRISMSFDTCVERCVLWSITMSGPRCAEVMSCQKCTIYSWPSMGVVMGGRGGGGGSYLSAHDVEILREEARKRLLQARTDSEINSYLQQELVSVNDRDVEETNSRLDAIEASLQSDAESFDRLLFGGSVAKHTYVDGLSDVDVLVVMDDESLAQTEPAKALEQLRDSLLRKLPNGAISEVRVGRLAVTVTYRDGMEIQLLPAVRSGDGVA